MSGHDVIVIGASAGGLRALKDLVSCLPADLPAACFAVLHGDAAQRDGIARALRGAGPLIVRFAEDGEPIRRGMLLLAPGGKHLVVGADSIRLTAGPRENFWRPSIDVLFRTAAVTHRSRTVGVILSGTLDDGAAGLAAIKACGGEALVQAPAEATFAEMPTAALRQVEGARALATVELCQELMRLAHAEAPTPPDVPAELELEARIAAADSSATAALALPSEISLYTCPECGGPLAAQRNRSWRFRCAVGHGFSVAALESGMRRQIESSLWVAIRLLQQRSNLTQALAEKERDRGRARGAQSYEERSSEDSAHAEVLQDLLMRLSGDPAPAKDEPESPVSATERPVEQLR